MYPACLVSSSFPHQVSAPTLCYVWAIGLSLSLASGREVASLGARALGSPTPPAAPQLARAGNERVRDDFTNVILGLAHFALILRSFCAHFPISPILWTLRPDPTALRIPMYSCARLYYQPIDNLCPWASVLATYPYIFTL
jgi:hypothetical protein